MRDELEKIEGKRTKFRGTFVRYGVKNGWMGREVKTVLLQGVVDSSGRKVTDHLWFNLTKSFEALNLQPGETVEFEGRSTPYLKGYMGHRDEWDDSAPPIQRDYKLVYPTRVRRFAPVRGQKTLEEITT